MAVGMLDKLTNYLMPMEEKPVKKQRAPENESDYGVKPVNLQVHTNQGVALKKMNTESRKALERFFDKVIYLETFVKVDKDWRSSQKELENFGYNPE